MPIHDLIELSSEQGSEPLQNKLIKKKARKRDFPGKLKRARFGDLLEEARTCDAAANEPSNEHKLSRMTKCQCRQNGPSS